MKRLIALLFAFGTTAALAQFPNPGIIQVDTAPSGSSTGYALPTQLQTPNGNVYSPFSANWTLTNTATTRQSPDSLINGSEVIKGNLYVQGTCTGCGAGTGTVTSVGLALPSDTFAVTGSPVTTNGTLTGTYSNQTANFVHAGPATGAAAPPTWRALVAADLPASVAYTNVANTFTAEQIFSNSPGTASGAYGTLFTGTPATSSIANPLFYVKCLGSTDPTFTTNGTLIQVNNCTGSSGNLLNLASNGTTEFNVNSGGTATATGGVTAGSTQQFQLNGRANLSSSGTGIFDCGTGSTAGDGCIFKANQFVTPPTTVTPSATPALVATNGLQTITLSANATPTITGIAAGQRITFQICQPATGGPYTWTWPASVHGGMTIGTTASTCSMQSFNSFTGTTLVPESVGVQNVAP